MKPLGKEKPNLAAPSGAYSIGQNSQGASRAVTVLGVQVETFSRTQFQSAILELLQNQKRGWICYVNVHTIDIANQLPWFKQFMMDALIRYCDGEGVRFGAYLLGEHIQERFTLSDYIYEFAQFAVDHHLNIFLLGGTPNVAELAAGELRTLYPLIRLSGYHHGYFSAEENNTVIDTINACHPDILLLGMGVPLQEEWTKKNFAKLNASLVWMGGGFLDTLSGTIKRCPPWLSKIGLMWLFRLVQEPRRLWKRYLIGIPMFVLRILHTRLFKQ
jgi:N-acetylglucosaminyldiphosphoundecaprenol N-acetyl-beta-D-mannosaminyltransferase